MLRWLAYERVAGPLTLHDRLDHAFANLAATLVAAFSGQEQSVADYLPQWSRTPKPEQSVEEIMRRFDTLSRNGGPQ